MYRSPDWPLGPTRSRLDEQLFCARVSAQFREMPGLTLTVSQAVRLFEMDRARCERALSSLVERGDLITDGREFSSARRSEHGVTGLGR
jgi:hypothetical protein